MSGAGEGRRSLRPSPLAEPVHPALEDPESVTPPTQPLISPPADAGAAAGASSHRSRRGPLIAALLVVAVLVLAVAARAASERIPPLSWHRVLASSVVLSGPAPQPAWPGEGEAAVAVEHLGSLGTSGPSTPVPIASVAKMMTAYLTLTDYPLASGQSGFVLHITPGDVRDEHQRAALGQSVVAVRAGERLSERQALQALMLPSANNIAVLLAVHDGGSVSAFVADMNATARRLGMTASTYTDPSGYDTTTMSTAADQLRLARAALGVPALAQIADERTAVLPVAGTVGNYDGLVGSDGYVGVKTGSDRAAGGCLAFAKRIVVDGHQLTVVGVVLGQRAGGYIPAALATARRLGDSVAAAVHRGVALAAHRAVYVGTPAAGGRSLLVSAHTLRAIGWGGLALPIGVTVPARATELKAHQPEAAIRIGGLLPATTPVVAERAVPAPSLGWRLRHLL